MAKDIPYDQKYYDPEIECLYAKRVVLRGHGQPQVGGTLVGVAFLQHSGLFNHLSLIHILPWGARAKRVSRAALTRWSRRVRSGTVSSGWRLRETTCS